MGLLYKDDPISDARVNCPECFAIEWVLRAPRLGGDEMITCAACGYSPGPPHPAEFYEGDGYEADELETGDRAVAAATFPVYAPAGLPWRPVGGSFNGPVAERVVIGCAEPLVTVTSERRGVAERDGNDPAQMMRLLLADALWDDLPPRGDLSPAAYTLEVYHREDQMDDRLAACSESRGVQVVDGHDAPCEVVQSGRVWATRIELGDMVILVDAVGIALADVALTRVK